MVLCRKIWRFAGNSGQNKTFRFAPQSSFLASLENRDLGHLRVPVLAGRLGFEPRLTGSEPGVLPLHYLPSRREC